MTNMKKRIATTLTAAILTTVLTVPAMAAETPDKSVRVSSYKGSTLKVGERSGLIIGPSSTDYTVTSSDPDTVAVEQVLTFWVAVAKGSGTAVITASNSTGECGSVTLTVGSVAPAASEAPASGDSADLMGNLEIRQEMIRLINQTRKDNGVPELPISEALMNAAQACSNRRYTWHHAPEESQAAVDAGYPYGFGDNLTVFTGTANAAQRAVDNWINSPGHYETMIDPRCDCIGVGITQCDGITYCYMFVGIPNSVNFYA
ncbi:MAG: CAP domain-containing protein [Lachnospiraceae bacterium]|nr:CAP domain-containing protein [Lachnospiraceae bacterium]